MRFLPWVSMAALLASSTAGHAQSVYKLEDASGATVYSDRPNLPGTTKQGTVNLTPGPSEEQQQAARQNVQQMENKSEEMRESRLNRERKNNQGQARDNAGVGVIESSTVDSVYGRRRLDPKTRIPVESPDGGEHPVYTPIDERPVHVAPHPRPRPRAGR